MRKFIPLILIVAMLGTFLWVSFVGSSTVLVPKYAGAEEVKSSGWLAKYGSAIYKNVSQAIVDTVWGNIGSIADATFGWALSWIGTFAWHLSAKLFTLSGMLLDYAVDFSVRDFKENIEKIKVIDEGYKAVLNVANMVFIFILLYIAIGTILQTNGKDVKKLLTNVIVVALFINFSLFMTKVIIDAGNILSMGFYNAIQTEAGKVKVDGEDKKIISVGSVSTAMMAGMKLQSQMPSQNSEYNKNDPSKGFTYFNIAINQFGGAALFLVSAFVFFSVAFLFIVRFVALLFYMIFSPVAFLGYISPEFSEHSKEWWKGLQSQVFFAPVFLFMAYIISRIVNSGQLWAAVGGDKQSTFYNVISSSGSIGFPIIMNYVILIGLLLTALTAAVKTAKIGSGEMVKYAEKARGWAQGVAGRQTLGRAAYVMGNSKTMAKFAAMSPTLGGFTKKQFDTVAGAKFGSKVGYTKALKDKVKQQADLGRFIDKKLGKEERTIVTDKKLATALGKDIAEEKNIQEKAIEDNARLKAGRDEAQKNYDTLEKEREEAQKTYETYQDEQSRVELEQAKNKAGDAKAELERAEGNLKKQEEAMKVSKEFVETAQKKLTDVKKTEKWKDSYAKNLEYGLGIKELNPWNIMNKLFPSGADAAAEIRKKKSTGEKEIYELVEKLVEEKAKEIAGGEKTP